MIPKLNCSPRPFDEIFLFSPKTNYFFMAIRSIYQKPTGAKGQDVDWITDATPIREDGELIIQIAGTTLKKLEVTLDGTDYYLLNIDTELVANSIYRFKIDIDNTMTFNLRCPDSEGVTIGTCLIKETPVVHTP